jgi:Family of unknown function (DUF6328)
VSTQGQASAGSPTGEEQQADSKPRARDGRDETPKERLDRNLEELLQGLRVALPGVQVLFAFLLVLPFQAGFSVTSFQKDVYFATLLCVTISSILLIAPTPRHRLLFRHDEKAWIVFAGNRLVIVGLAFLGIGIVGAILLISDFLFGTATAAVASSAVALAVLWAWFGSPLARRIRDPG